MFSLVGAINIKNIKTSFSSQLPRMFCGYLDVLSHSCQDALHRIAPGSRIDSDFPPKHLFSCEGPKLEDRRHGLERQGVGG